ncbi:hypothetical protein H0N98_05160 [Candidatus Micrarchaeota archaeon]|nr:hypothetical protein [Candidatus Micrarchaeota archaeon]
MAFAERRTDVEEKVPFGHGVSLVISEKVDELWSMLREDEVDFPKFSFKVGMKIVELGGPETLLKFLGKNELRDKELAQRLEKEARGRIESRGRGGV